MTVTNRRTIAWALMIMGLLAGTGRGLLSHQGVATDSPTGDARAKPAVREPSEVPTESLHRRAEPARSDRYGDPLPVGAVARHGTLRFYQAEDIYNLTFSPNGALLVACSLGTTVVWELATGKERHCFKGHNLHHAPAVFSADSQRLTLVGADQMLQVWDLAPSKRLLRVSPLPRNFSDVVFASGDETAAVLMEDETVRLWNVSAGKELRRFALPHRPEGEKPGFTPDALGLSADGRTLAVAGGFEKTSRILLWDTKTGKELQAIPRKGACEKMRFLKLFFSPNGSTLVGLCPPNPPQMWDVATGKELPGRPRHPSYQLTWSGFSPDGRFLASTEDSTIVVKEVATGKEVRRIPTASWQAVILAFSPDGKMLATTEGRRTIRLWDVATGRPLGPRSGHVGEVVCVACSPDGQRAASVDSDNTVCLWDTATGRELRRFRRPPSGTQGGAPISCAVTAFSGDGGTLAVAWCDGLVHRWETGTGKVLGPLSDPPHLGILRGAASPDGRLLALLYDDSRAGIWEMASGKRLHSFRYGSDPPPSYELPFPWPSALAFSPDGKTLFVVVQERRKYEAAAVSSTVYLWEVVTHKERGRFRLQQNLAQGPNGRDYDVTVEAVRLAPDSRTVLLRTWHRVRLWDLVANSEVGQVEVQPAFSRAFAFSPDGRVLALGDVGGAVRLWEVAPGKELPGLTGHRGKVTALAFSPDGKNLLSGAEDTTVLVWDMPALRAAGLKRPNSSLCKELEALWNDLACADAARAYGAIVELAEAPEKAVPFLRERLRPALAMDAKQIDQWIADLDSAHFAVRQQASVELEKLGSAAEAALQRVCNGHPSPELRQRVEQLLEKRQGPLTPPEQLRPLRAVEVLERIASIEALQVLQTLTRGTPGSELTEGAKAALERLAKRPLPSPKPAK